MLNRYLSGFGGAEVVIKNVMQKSRHDISVANLESNIDVHDYDLVHVHNVWEKNLNVLRDLKLVMSIHDYRLTKCARGMRLCEAVPMNCLSCRGLLSLHLIRTQVRPTKHFVASLKPKLIVHSLFMQKYYRDLMPYYLPIPLEIEDMTPSTNHEAYLFYSGRCSHEKNPIGFAKLCQTLNVKGIMALSISNTYFKDYMRKFQDFNQVDIVIEPSWKELKELYRHAKLTVHPYLFAEPFGISCVNSILLGTPLISYPFGNLRNVSTYTAYPFKTLVKKVKKLVGDEKEYNLALAKTMGMRQKFLKEFDSIKKWDEFYEKQAT